MIIKIENLERILEAQKKLDKAILTEAGFNEDTYPAKQTRIAYNVELGELAQEWKGFKYWKKTKGEIDRTKLIEEYADCLHFAVSLANNQLDKNPGMKRFFDANISTLGAYAEEKLQAKGTKLNTTGMLLKCFDSFNNSGITVLTNTLMLGISLEFTWEEIEEAYFYKNNINWERLASGY